MRNAYALLGLAFIVVFGGAYLIFNKAEAPSTDDVPASADATEILPVTNEITMSLQLTSPAFAEGGTIPSLYTCDGDSINPPLTISGVPAGTQSLVLVMDDPDIPQEFKDARGIEKFDHWSVYNISPDTTEIPAGLAEGDLGQSGFNSKDGRNYTGPCPPPEYEPTKHRYIFRLYALPEQIAFRATPTLDQVESLAQSIAIEEAQLIGVYDKSLKE